MKVGLWFLVGLSLALSSAAACVRPANTVTDSIAVVAQTRTVKDRVLTSTQLPAVQIEFAEPFKYAGGHSFVLYEVANAEQHFFVDADKDGRVKRMYWVQFEGYLPSNTHSYDYKSPKKVNIGGLDFFADAYARNIKVNAGRPDSDGNRARAFLASKGYRLGSDEVISQRLVNLIDEAKRNELMIIYLEDLSSMKLTAADLAKGGKAAGQWEVISAGLLERATKNMKLSR
ncbi:MAG TPA: hypothetical protein VFR80_17030 [Pyrinomonadaceae bacterium]|nr:hypothetical protein [Pyrinomonadaceae bacterium]